ncbi:aminotransferase class V-fold PLP-dependent enzyme [Candidatus Uhrbacteria bacterium]|nr:aminotransferase class V-fold PLP-dependent enzyme [Candidatus Uhrbacteria bacterium]
MTPNTTPTRAVYLDHAATTPMDPHVVDAMRPYFIEEYGNPSSLYAAGRSAKEAIDHARRMVATVLQCHPEELVFTGSGTESDNMAVLGIARYHRARGNHLLVSAIEHHAVLGAAEHLRKEGHVLDVLPVDQDGVVDPAQVRAALRPETTLVSVMMANNEIGTIEPIHEIAKTIREWKQEHGRKPNDPPFFHTDACQAAGACALALPKLGVDLLTINGAKIYGPKGTGALYIRRGVRLEPLVYGGGQEHRLRSGTEHVAGIVGFATALEIAEACRVPESVRLSHLRDQLIAGIVQRVPKIVLNGHPTNRLPNNVNVSILDIEGEAMLLYLDAYGIAAATGSACDSQSLDPSHVILAIGHPYEYAHASIRFTLGRSTTEEDIAYVLDVLPGIVEKLRKISPVRLEMGQQRCAVGSGAASATVSAFAGQGRPHWEQRK